MIKIEISSSNKEKNNMNSRCKSTIAIVISILAIIISLLPYILPPCKCCMSEDFVVSVLAIIVTILIGWNLYSAIRIDERVDSVAMKVTEYEKTLCENEKKFNEFKDEVNDKVEKASKTAMILSLAQSGMAFYNISCKEEEGNGSQHYGQAVQLLFNAQSLIQDDNTKVDEIYDEANKHSQIILKEIANRENFVLCTDSEEEREMFIETAKRIGDDDIIRMARNTKVRKSSQT